MGGTRYEHGGEISMGGKTESKNVTVKRTRQFRWLPQIEKRRQTIDTLVQLSREADAGRKKAASIQTGLTRLVTSWKARTRLKFPMLSRGTPMSYLQSQRR